MSENAAESPFKGAAAYYSRFRPPYAPAALEWLAEQAGLNSAARVLDLGCGPGTLAIPLSRYAADIVAVDRDTEMLDEARRLANEAGGDNIAFVQSTAEALSPSLGTFRLVTLGQSFHWMARDTVLERLSDLVEDGGALALIAPYGGWTHEPWWDVVTEIVVRYVGPRERLPRPDPEPHNTPALLRSRRFHQFTSQVFDHAIERDVQSIIGLVYSMSISQLHRFGVRVEAFEADLRQGLLRLESSGRFPERIPTEIVLAPRQPG